MRVPPVFPVSVLGLAAQVPLPSPLNSTNSMASLDSVFKEGADVFSPKDLIALPRPGVGVANPDKADLVFVPVSQYSFETKKLVHMASSRYHMPTATLTAPFQDEQDHIHRAVGG